MWLSRCVGRAGRGTRRASRAKWSRLIRTHALWSASVALTMPQRLLHPAQPVVGVGQFAMQLEHVEALGSPASLSHAPSARSSTCAYTSAGPRRALSICRPS